MTPDFDAAWDYHVRYWGVLTDTEDWRNHTDNIVRSALGLPVGVITGEIPDELIECKHVIMAGPGHQSEHECVTPGHHHNHDSGSPYHYEWSTCQEVKPDWSETPIGYSGYFNESPEWCDGHEEKEDEGGAW